MQQQRQCKTCGRDFIAIKETQLFCQRKCFKRDYYLRKRAELEAAGPQFPHYRCENCEADNHLGFDPITQPLAYNSFVCSACSVPRDASYVGTYSTITIHTSVSTGTSYVSITHTTFR